MTDDPEKPTESEVPSRPEQERDIEQIVAAVRTVVKDGIISNSGKARRDVHAKQHGCVLGRFVIGKDRAEGNAAGGLNQGLFQREGDYPAWIRFSSSNKRIQSDEVGDGRGMAIKVLVPDDIHGKHLSQDANTNRTQDFVLLNAPAFFVRNMHDMAEAAILEAKDEFPSSFFIRSLKRLPGLTAAMRMSGAKVGSPLEITYFSQTPYCLGPDRKMKYRLRPKEQTVPPSASPSGDDYLYEAMRDRLEGNGPNTEVVFAFEVQLHNGSPALPLDDATIVWEESESPFIEVAELRIPRQKFSGGRRMLLAEKIFYNPWNALEAHKPLGTINEARLHAYQASRDERYRLNKANKVPGFDDSRPVFSEATWNAEFFELDGAPWAPDRVPRLGKALEGFRTLVSILPGPADYIARKLSGPFGFAAAPVLLVGLVLYGTRCNPTFFCGPFTLGIGNHFMASERFIPPAIYGPVYEGTSFATDERVRERDVVWTFRYQPSGSEYYGGMPYWIYRVLPRLVPEHFDKRGDWSLFGLKQRDDTDYYTSYHDLPRGLVLSDVVVHLGGNDIGFDLKVVSFNCATCHRGEYINYRADPRGVSTFVDGMPNGMIDTAGYKVASFRAMKDPRFNYESVVDAIDQLLAEEHKRRPTFDDGSPTPTKLSTFERAIYAVVVQEAKKRANEKDIDWMDDRPLNGLGRLDAFSALRFEFLHMKEAPPEPTAVKRECSAVTLAASQLSALPIATVDLPSIWNQSDSWRPLHHWDGNTDQPKARNFGAIIGVGGIPSSIHQGDVVRIGNWIDFDLKPPAYPFPPPVKSSAQEGQKIYERQCAGCHGKYDGKRLVELGDCMKNPVNVGTDGKRAEAVDPKFVEKLNAFGRYSGLWQSDAFTSKQGYLCPPLDGIWARAPYLHNGSVPTLWHLLGPEGKRPPTFKRGNPEYDTEKGGFKFDSAREGRESFEFDTLRPGNSSAGHACDKQLVLDEQNRRDVIAYLLTL